MLNSYHIVEKKTEDGWRFYPFSGDHLPAPNENSAFVLAKKDGLVEIHVDTAGNWSPDFASRLGYALSCAADKARRV